MRSKYIFLITTKQNILCKINFNKIDYFADLPQTI